jgi:fatty acid desaturase
MFKYEDSKIVQSMVWFGIALNTSWAFRLLDALLLEDTTFTNPAAAAALAENMYIITIGFVIFTAALMIIWLLVGSVYLFGNMATGKRKWQLDKREKELQEREM